MINNPIVFYIAFFLIIFFAILSIWVKNVIYSLLAAIMVFFTASIFFYILGSEYNAIIQAAIYGLAVPVIIGVSIMFTTRREKSKSSFMPLLIMIFAAAFIFLFADVVYISNLKLPLSFHFMEIQQFNSYDVISEFARGIFIDYVWSFELLSLLLTIIIAGFTLFDKKGRG